MTDASFAYLATETAHTLRSPAFSSGNRGEQDGELATFACFPLDPVDPELTAQLTVGQVRRVLQTFAQGGLDIEAGDRLVVDNKEYPIRAVSPWKWEPDGENFLHLIVVEVMSA